MILPNHILIPEFVAKAIGEGKTAILPLRGYSMRPYLEDNRDKALLAPLPDVLRRGDVILAEIAPKRYALHRIVSIDGDAIVMYGDGNFAPEQIHRKDVIAIAIGFYRKGSDRLDSVSSNSYIIYWKLWVLMRPIRRCLLLAWRLCHYPRITIRHIIKKIFKI